MRVLARSGYVANGLIHALVGIIVIVIAAGGDADGDQSGALQAIGDAPLGFVALWALAIALWALAVWNLLETVTARRPGVRVKNAGLMLVYGALGFVTAGVALGVRSDPDETATQASRGVLQVPGGPIVLGIIGAGVVVAGVVFAAMGVLQRFEKEMDIPHGKRGRTVRSLGVIGYVAKGASLVIVGVLLLIAAFRSDAAAAGGLDAALDGLRATVFGPWAVGAVGVGFIAYGAFLAVRARWARL